MRVSRTTNSFRLSYCASQLIYSFSKQRQNVTDSATNRQGKAKDSVTNEGLLTRWISKTEKEQTRCYDREDSV